MELWVWGCSFIVSRVTTWCGQSHPPQKAQSTAQQERSDFSDRTVVVCRCCCCCRLSLQVVVAVGVVAKACGHKKMHHRRRGRTWFPELFASLLVKSWFSWNQRFGKLLCLHQKVTCLICARAQKLLP